VIREALALLESISEEESGHQAAPGSWSPKEVLGHLIDSATQNHRRFVELYGQENLEFSPYDQEHWVGTQQYQSRPWEDLVLFWKAYNLHLAHLVTSFPPEEFLRPRHPHNLDRFTIPIASAEESVTLKNLVRHYLDHMKIHLNQIEEIRELS
jgi:hypothetical protein